MNCELAAELNNLGVSYLAAGYLRKSLELFRDALKYTLCDLQADTSTVGAFALGFPSRATLVNAAAFCSSSEQETVMDHIKLSEHSASQLSGNPTQCDTARPSPSSVPFVHSHAINVVSSSHAYSPDALINTTVISSIILFNLGVVYHLKGLEGSGESSLRLSKARAFYLKSQILLADAGVPHHSSGNPVIDMLCMALYNNLAQTSYEMLVYEDSRNYFESLIRFALTVVPSRYRDQSIASMIDQQKSNFLLNAIILHAPKFAAAA